MNDLIYGKGLLLIVLYKVLGLRVDGGHNVLFVCELFKEEDFLFSPGDF